MNAITPEEVAAHLGYDSRGAEPALVIVNRRGATLDISVTRDGSTSKFRAVVEAEPNPRKAGGSA